MKEVKQEWEQFSSNVFNRNLSIQIEIENENGYNLFAVDGQILFTSYIYKTEPRNADQIDFEDNFLERVNAPTDIQNHIIEYEEFNDHTTYTITYKGWCRFQGNSSEAIWRLQRIKVEGNLTTKEYANYGKYDQIWDNRVTIFGD